jgi:hypothetical protein
VRICRACYGKRGRRNSLKDAVSPRSLVTPAVAVEPEATITFPPRLPADMPQGGWRNPEAEIMQPYLNLHPQKPKQMETRHKPASMRHGETPERNASPPHMIVGCPASLGAACVQ